MAGRDIRSLDIGMLRAFDALMREHSVSRAADRLFLSQPAVSAALSRLRDTFDDPLFTRTAHGVAPTPRALALASRVERVLDDVNSMLEIPKAFDPATSERIFRIAGSDYTGQILLPFVAALLREHESRVRIVFEPAIFSTMIDRLRRGDLDIAVTPQPHLAGDLESVLLYEDSYVFAARPGHPQFRAGLSLDAFCAVPQVFFGFGASGFEGLTDDILRSLGRRRFVQIAAQSFNQVAELLGRLDYGAVLPRRVAGMYADRLETHELPFDLPGYQTFLCWHRRAAEDPGVQWLRHELVRGAALTAG